MDKIKEKPKAASSIREKVKAAPKELVRRGLEDGADRLRPQLRDAAQQGRQDNYGGDQIEDTAAGGMRRMERSAEKLLKERRKNRTGRAVETSDGPAAESVGAENPAGERGAGPKAAMAHAPTEHMADGGQRIKTRDAYLYAQRETPATGLSSDRTQGQQPFIRERGRQAAKGHRKAETEQRRAEKTGTNAPVRDGGIGSPDARQSVSSATPPSQRSGQRGAPAPGAAGSPAAPRHVTSPKTAPGGAAPHTPACHLGRQGPEAPAVHGPREKGAVVRMRHSVQGTKRAAAEPTVRTATTTANAAAGAAQRAGTARAAQQAAQYRQRAKAVGGAAKKAAANAGKALRAILAAARSLMAAAAAGGAVVLSLLIVICLVGLLIASPFGILFASEPVDDSSVALSTAIAQVNVEYTQRLDELQEGDYDQIIINGAPPDWREVVAVFAVRTAGTNDGVDVVTLDEDRVNRLREVFWDMVALSSASETIEHGDSDPDDGVDDSWTETILTITVTGRTLDEMRDFYTFTDEQNNMLDELLDNLDLIGGAIGNLTVTEADAKELLAALPDDLSAERREIIETACQLVGKVNYFWGGKSLVIGWDDRWGTLQQVTAAGSSTTGTYRPYGLDCSGFVDWVFYNASGGAYILGHGGGARAQHSYCTPISWEDALPGDLVFYPDDEHVGIVGGRDEGGGLRIIHCASGANNVVITGIEGFTSIGRPVYFSG